MVKYHCLDNSAWRGVIPVGWIAAEGNGSFKERVILQLVKFVGWAFVILAALAGVVKYLEAAK